MKKSSTILLRELPGVDELVRHETLGALLARYSHEVITDAAREVLERLRLNILREEDEKSVKSINKAVCIDDIASMVTESLEAFAGAGLKRVVNGTGTILHTNLGRAQLAEEAARAAFNAALYPVDLEMDITTGVRTERDRAVEALVCALTGAEAACVVNNNAGAVLLALNTLAEGAEVVVSRGELIEIGGSFRLPDIIEKSGCRLKEVGTTNRTHASDYTGAITDSTALLFKAHRSNYEVVGFTAEVGLKELVKIAEEGGVALVEDLGAGALIDMARFGLPKEPVVAQRLEAGVDIVTFSGDKLLGGPQSGIIAGKRKLVDKIRNNPLKRALRCDKMTIAALEATLKLYLNGEELCNRLPVLRLMTRSVEEITGNANRAALLLRERLGPGYTVEVKELGTDGADGSVAGSVVGGGSLPGYGLPTAVIVVTHEELSAQSIYNRFLASSTPILGRINKELFLLDMRTVEEPEEVLP
ncbi:MAG: L-seryl-tRNA(Sec) selenium transferase [Proteobacteria bacterium]|nr:L-seryl-tRNA(Sec) selenium transferase [Pseudomonadota bacterium]